MPRCGSRPEDRSYPSNQERVYNGILERCGVPANEVKNVHTEQNHAGLLVAIDAGERKPKLLLVDMDGRTTKDSELPQSRADVLKEWLNDPNITTQERSVIELALRGLEHPDRPVDVPDAGVPSVFNLQSIFAKPEPLTYLIEPELPERSVVYLAGDSESGKSTLACAWGRELTYGGHAVLLLDRDRNPRERIQDRLKRLGITAADALFWVWDNDQPFDVPQPDSPEVLDWCRTMYERTGKSPLVIIDSLVAFFLTGESENDANSMRAVVDRCRAVNKAGGTVILIHHLGKNGDPRGSSDFKPAGDQGFLVSNSAKHELVRIRLEVHKTRYRLTDAIHYDYANGRIIRSSDAGKPEDGPSKKRDGKKDVTAKLMELLAKNPGIGTRDFEIAAKAIGVANHKALEFLHDASLVRYEKVGKKHCHWLINPLGVPR